MSLQAHEDDVEDDVLCGLEEQGTNFNVPTGPAVPATRQKDVITFGIPSLLPQQSTASSSRAEVK